MDTTTIDYKKVKCPKCGKSYFRVKENSGINLTNLVFTTKPDPIYKDGELQNPTEDEPIKVRCECLECGCNFRVETYDVFWGLSVYRRGRRVGRKQEKARRKF